MNITNDTPPADPIEYITKQLSKDLVKLIEVRDELVKRQGAMSAVEAAITQKAEADAYYANTKEACDKLIEDTRETNKVAREKKKKLDDREAEIAKREIEVAANYAKKESELAAREKELTALAVRHDVQAADLSVREEKLRFSQTEHANRVKAFQEKVAQITA